MTTRKAVVIEAKDMPEDVLDWCVNNEISTHYDHSLAMIWEDEIEENPLFKWLTIGRGIDMEEFKGRTCYYVAIIAT